MVRHVQICSICEQQVRSDHLARHKKRRHPNAPLTRPSPTPVEQFERIKDVLLACGIQEQLGDWNIEELNKLPNI